VDLGASLVITTSVVEGNAIIGFTVGQWLLNLLAIVQFLWLLVAREHNQFIAGFGNSLDSR
jgi:hypothetical protein